MIPTNFKKYGQNFEQIRRSGNIAIFKRWDSDFICFEVIKVKYSADRTIGDKFIPAHEYYPGHEDFGKFGWTYGNLEQAEAKFIELVSKELANTHI